MGHAFVNMVSPLHIVPFQQVFTFSLHSCFRKLLLPDMSVETSNVFLCLFLQTFNGKIWEKFNSGKVASLAYAEIQGKSALASYMQNPSTMKEEKQLFPLVSHHHDEGHDSDDQVGYWIQTLFFFCFDRWIQNLDCLPNAYAVSSHFMSSDFTLYIWISYRSNYFQAFGT